MFFDCQRSVRRVVLSLPVVLGGAGAVAMDYPEGSAIPRGLTEGEAALVAEHPIVAPNLRGAPPTGAVRTPAEYDPMEGIIIAWEGPSGWTNILKQMAKEITVTGGGTVWVMVDTTGERSTVQGILSGYGVDMSKVEFVVERTDTIWCRDYGPRIIYEGVGPDGTGGVRAIVDHTYNRPRPNDDGLPDHLAGLWGWDSYDIPLVHGGGNFHLASGAPGVQSSPGFSTELIADENPSLTDQQIIDYWNDFQNLNTDITDAYPFYIDSTQHIDMWMEVIGDSAAVISDWPLNSGSAQDIVSDGVAADLSAQGWTITRVPGVSSGGTHYTFTNVVVFNDLVLIPTYTNSTASQYNAAALAAWQTACPGKTIVQINCQDIVTAAGVMHCIMMHVPAEPVNVEVLSWNGNDTLTPGMQAWFDWSTAGTTGASLYDFDYSLDGGASWVNVIDHDDNTNGYYWPVPDVSSTEVKVRVTVFDDNGMTGTDTTDGLMTIDGGCAVDLTDDGVVDSGDLGAFITLFLAGDLAVDFTSDGVIDSGDLGAFITLFLAGC